MSILKTKLHPKNNPADTIYPDIELDNIPAGDEGKVLTSTEDGVSWEDPEIPSNMVTTDTEQELSAKKTWKNSSYKSYIQPNAVAVENTDGSNKASMTPSVISVGSSTKLREGAIDYNNVEFELPSDKADTQIIAMKSDIDALSEVAKTGSYDDLENKPTIPSTDNMVTTNTDQAISANKEFNGDVNFNGAIEDSSGSTGTAGQVLESTGSGTVLWTNVSSGGNLVITDTLPTPTEILFNEGKLYLVNNVISYIGKKIVSEPVVSNVTALPSARYLTSAVSIGTNAYIFGGYDGNVHLSSIVKFDSTSNTVTTLSAALPSTRTNTSAVSIGTNAYILGGYSNNGRYLQ